MIRKRSYVLGAISVTSWLVVISGRYLLWLEYYGRFAERLILVSAFVVAAVSTSAWALSLTRRRGRASGYAMSAAAVALIAAVVLLPWNSIFARTWFAANHGKFVALAGMAEDGRLPADTPSGGWVDLPDGFGFLNFGHSATQNISLELYAGRVLMLGMSEEEVSENMFLHIYDRPDAARISPCELTETTFDDFYWCTRLGDGWWWLQRKENYPELT